MGKADKKKKYLADPELCPYCGDEHVYCTDEPCGELLMEWLMLNKDIPLDMQCGSCEREWVKIHRHKVNDVEFKPRKEVKPMTKIVDIEKAKAKYIADPSRCPYCDLIDKSYVTDSGLDERLDQQDMDERLVECGECHNQWRETVKKVVVDVDFGDELDPLSTTDLDSRLA